MNCDNKRATFCNIRPAVHSVWLSRRATGHTPATQTGKKVQEKWPEKWRRRSAERVSSARLQCPSPMRSPMRRVGNFRFGRQLNVAARGPTFGPLCGLLFGPSEGQENGQNGWKWVEIGALFCSPQRRVNDATKQKSRALFFSSLRSHSQLRNGRIRLAATHSGQKKQQRKSTAKLRPKITTID